MNLVTKLVMEREKATFSVSSPFTKPEHIETIQAIHREQLLSKIEGREHLLDKPETLSIESLEEVVKGLKAGVLTISLAISNVTDDKNQLTLLLKLERKK